jgi:hypothetical protein
LAPRPQVEIQSHADLLNHRARPRCALAAGRTAGAQAGLRQAREIFQRIGAAEAADVSAELDALTGTGPAADRS